MRSLSIDGKSGYHLEALSIDAGEGVLFASFYAYSHHIERMFKISKKETIDFTIDSYRGRPRIKSFNDYHIERSVDAATDLCHIVLLKKDETNDENKTFTFQILGEGAIDSTIFFDKLNAATSIPLLPEWKDYILTRLLSSSQLRQRSITCFDDHTNLQLWQCSSSDTQILNIVSAGLENRDIFIDPKKPNSKISETIGLDAYLAQFSSHLTTRIQEKFTARFNPLTDKYSQAILDFEDWCYNSGNGIQLFDAQKSVGAASIECLKKEHVVFVVGEMGVGRCYN